MVRRIAFCCALMAAATLVAAGCATPQPKPAAAAPAAVLSPTAMPTATPIPVATPVSTEQSGQPSTAPLIAATARLLGGEQRGQDLVGKLVSEPEDPTTGFNTLDLALTDAQGQAVQGARVSFDLNMTNMHMPPQVVTANPAGPGRYRGDVDFSMVGPWRVIATVERAGDKAQQLQFSFPIEIVGVAGETACH